MYRYRVIELPIRDGNYFNYLSPLPHQIVIELPIRDGNMICSPMVDVRLKLLNFL